MPRSSSRSCVECEVCGASSQYWASIHGFSHFKCSECGHLFVFPRPSQALLDVFYQKGEYYCKAENQRGRLSKEARQRARRLRAMADVYRLVPCVLDVGCASGIFIGEATAEGFSAQGVERSSVMAARAREHTRQPIEVGIFEEMIIADSPFPIVTAWEVLEHSLDIRSFFSALSRNVAPGGLLAISTPMSDGLIARILGLRFPMLTPPEHLSLFSRKSLAQLAAKNGFQCVAFRSFSNIDAQSIASGLARYVMGQELEKVSASVRRLAKCSGHALSWLPWMIDSIGGGSEMEVVFCKTKS